MRIRKEGPFTKYGGAKAWAVTGIGRGGTSESTQRTFAKNILDKKKYKTRTIASLAAFPFFASAALSAFTGAADNGLAHAITQTSPDAISAVNFALACGSSIAALALTKTAVQSPWRWGKAYFNTKDAATRAANEDTTAQNTLVKKYLRANHWALIDYAGTAGFLALGAAANAFPVFGQFAGPVIAVGGSFGYGLLIDALQLGAKKHMYVDANSYHPYENTTQTNQPQQRRRH